MRKETLCLLLCALLLLGALNLSGALFALTNDSQGYLTFAEVLRGTLSQNSNDLAIAVRPPLYPGLLALARYFVDDWSLAVRVVHSATAVIALAGFWLAVRAAMPTTIAPVIAGLGIATGQAMYPWLLAEWTTFCLLMLMYSSVILALGKRSLANITCVAWTTALIILTRSVFAFLCAIPLWFGLRLFLYSPRRWVSVPVFATALLPFFVWSVAAKNIIGTTTGYQAGAANLFSIAALLGPAEPKPTDPPAVRSFFAEVNARRHHVSDAQMKELLHTDDVFLAQAGNMELLTNLQKELRLPWPEIADLATIFSKRVLGANIMRYLAYVTASFRAIIPALPMLSIAIVLALWSLRVRLSANVASVVILAVAVHCVHLTLVSALSIVNDRYLMLTECPIAALTLLLAFTQYERVRTWLAQRSRA